ncbi:N-6 DNA methylase [Thiothrix subterranea]|uniref:Eco57I restriction-modification methylase domain-containing protein n=1 Tax=Thiothrix subterranea TaxID=2735563 RepID=UPI00192C599C|nr:N-6 DNA methylase [Thiothrix subterranea]QQZ29346.1 N-6 DNA methylase [Thiothrix subterranea]
MPLFQPKLLEKHLTIPAVVPPEHLQAIREWQRDITNGKLGKLGEVSAHNLFIQTILVRLLGYTVEGDEWTAYHECPVQRDSIDVGLGKFTAKTTRIIAPLELKGLDTANLDAVMPKRHETPVQQAWRYAMKVPGAKWALVSNYRELRLYAVGYGMQAYESWQLETLHQPAEYARFHALLCAAHLLEGYTENLLLENEKVEKDITNSLYADYRRLRMSLITELQANYPELASHILLQYAQTIIDRILFIAFAEDKGLLPDRIIERAYEQQNPFNPSPVWHNFNGLFRAIDKGNAALKIPAYNGGLFAADAGLDAVQLSDALCEGFRDLARYDFASEVSVTVLGHIFEQSIADLEQLQEQLASGAVLHEDTSKARATTGKRKQYGVVYTPNHITRFIVEQTLGSYLQREFQQLATGYQKVLKSGEVRWKAQMAERAFWYAWRERLKSLRILDPACGSGAFLVAAFDYLVTEYKRINDTLHDLTGAYDVFDLNKTILNHNLYGVDLNAESVEITRLSLWLKTAEWGKPLENLDRAIRCGNSVVADATVDRQAFDWQAEFPQVFAEGGFDVVLGNPPYVRMELLKPIKPYLEKHYAVASDRADLYAYFFELGLKLLKPNGKLGYISSSTFFRTGSGERLRQHLRTQARLDTIVDFGDTQIFEGVTTYPAILVMEKATGDSDIRFLKVSEQLGSELAQQFSDAAKTMPQHRLTGESWQFEDTALADLRTKLTAGKRTLKDVYGSPLYGIKTGLNEAFVVDRATRDRLIAEDPRSAELLKPFLEGKDLKQWRIEPRDLWLIYIPKNVLDIDNYPAIKAYMLPFKNKLEQRATKQAWFELQQAQAAYAPLMQKDKIIYGHFSPNALFSYEKQGFHSNDKSYFIPNPDFYLLGLLNSKPFWYLIAAMCPAVRGGFYEVRVQYIETLPIPEATDAQRQEIARLAESCQQLAEQRYRIEERMCRRIAADLCTPDHEAKLNQKLQAWWQLNFTNFRTEVKKCLKAEIPLKERDDWADLLTERTQQVQALSAELASKEALLNQAVYALFELTREEITLLENSS